MRTANIKQYVTLETLFGDRFRIRDVNSPF